MWAWASRKSPFNIARMTSHLATSIARWARIRPSSNSKVMSPNIPLSTQYFSKFCFMHWNNLTSINDLTPISLNPTYRRVVLNGFLVHETFIWLRVRQKNNQLGKLQKLRRLSHFLLKTNQLFNAPTPARAKNTKLILQLKIQNFLVSWSNHKFFR